MGGGLWPRGGKKTKTRPDIARRTERQRDGESCYCTRKRRILRSDAHWPSRRVVEILNPCTDARPTETCVTPTCVAPRHVDASREFIFIFSERAAWGWGGGGAALSDFVFFSFFTCSANHERDWPPFKVVFFRLATNALNVRNANGFPCILCLCDTRAWPLMILFSIPLDFSVYPSPYSCMVR